jgi:hypothetical protein
MSRYVFRLTIAIFGFAVGCSASWFWVRTSVASRATANIRVNVKPLIDKAGRIGDGPFSPIKTTVAKLRAFHVEPLDNRIPPGVETLLRELKCQLRDLAADTLNEHGGEVSNAEEVEEKLNSILREQGLLVNEDADPNGDEYLHKGFFYGGIYAFSVRLAPNNPDWLAITTELELCCGSDTSLYFFKHSGTKWELALAQEANNYHDVSGAQGQFQYAISTPDREKRFFVVTANVNPWCTSNWQQLRYEVLRPSKYAFQPISLLKRQETIYLGVDQAYQLDVRSDRISLRFLGDKYADSMIGDMPMGPNNENAFQRPRFRISGNRVVQVSK